MLILAIETSCDETAICLADFYKDKIKIYHNLISSQVKLHAKFGGVVPNLASREHLKNIFPLLKIVLKNKNIIKKIDTIAVTSGPGLMPSLLIGVNIAKTLSMIWNKPIIPVNHLEGHIVSTWLIPIGENLYSIKKIIYPALNLIVSGGHTQLVLMKKANNFKILGMTLDDAVGEAFDKVAKILNLGYPGGPAIAAAAAQISNFKFQIPNKLPRPMIDSKNFDFSFSGLKTAVLYTVQKLLKNNKLSDIQASIANEFQNAAIDVLIKKTIDAAQKYKVKTITLSGGVAANKVLREKLEIESKKNSTFFIMPEIKLCGDNALMIATAAYSKLNKKNVFRKWNDFSAKPNLNF